MVNHPATHPKNSTMTYKDTGNPLRDMERFLQSGTVYEPKFKPLPKGTFVKTA